MDEGISKGSFQCLFWLGGSCVGVVRLQETGKQLRELWCYMYYFMSISRNYYSVDKLISV